MIGKKQMAAISLFYVILSGLGLRVGRALRGFLCPMLRCL